MQKVAVVTGAARGIGLATAKRFLADDWRVVLLDIDQQTLNQSAAALPDRDAILPICCDVADAAGVGKAFAAIVDTFGRLDALVNMPASRSSNRFSTSLMRSGHGCWRSTSRDRFSAPRPRLR